MISRPNDKIEVHNWRLLGRENVCMTEKERHSKELETRDIELDWEIMRIQMSINGNYNPLNRRGDDAL